MTLTGKIVFLTGGTGNLGRVVTRLCLEQGATVIITGRQQNKLESFQKEMAELSPGFKDRLYLITMDASSPQSITDGVKIIKEKYKQIDVLINNAGSAGPIQTISNIPTTKEELTLLKYDETPLVETLQDTIQSLLGFPWMLSCALLPLLNKGGHIINVSTIFSKMNYYGRCAYVTPKAALNQLSHLMAKELGVKRYQIRVNTVYPGPIESDRIRSVFSLMDKLKNVPQGSTAEEICSRMFLESSTNEETFVPKEDVAQLIVFLASDSAQQFSDHEFEITRGMQVENDDPLEIPLIPCCKPNSLEGQFHWFIGGNELEETCAMAKAHHDKKAKILLCFRDDNAVQQAKTILKDKHNIEVKRFDPGQLTDWEQITNNFKKTKCFPNFVLNFPHHGNDHLINHYRNDLLKIPLNKINAFLNDEIADPIIIARGISRVLDASLQYQNKPATVTFISNPSDGCEDQLNKIRHAAISQLIRTWMHEATFNKLLSEPGALNIHQVNRFKNDSGNNLKRTIELTLTLSANLLTIENINIDII